MTRQEGCQLEKNLLWSFASPTRALKLNYQRLKFQLTRYVKLNNKLLQTWVNLKSNLSTKLWKKVKQQNNFQPSMEQSFDDLRQATEKLVKEWWNLKTTKLKTELRKSFAIIKVVTFFLVFWIWWMRKL